MSKWIRSTRRITLGDIPPEIFTEVKTHITEYNLGPILDDYQMCIETVSNTKKKFFGLFGGKNPRTQVAILTPGWLILGSRGKKEGSAAALSVQLKDVTIMDHKDHPTYKHVPDTGLHVTGIFTGRIGRHGFQRVSTYMGLGEETDAQKFVGLLSRAIEKARV
jgi:hypothetical protein